MFNCTTSFIPIYRTVTKPVAVLHRIIRHGARHVFKVRHYAAHKIATVMMVTCVMVPAGVGAVKLIAWPNWPQTVYVPNQDSGIVVIGGPVTNAPEPSSLAILCLPIIFLAYKSRKH